MAMVVDRMLILFSLLRDDLSRTTADVQISAQNSTLASVVIVPLGK